MKEKGFSAVVLIIAASLVVTGIVVASFLSSKQQNISSRVETIANLPTTQPGSEVKMEIALLEPINVQDELDNPQVHKIQIKNNNGSLEVLIEEASDSGNLNRRGETDKGVLPNIVIKPTAAGLELDSQGVKATTSFPLTFSKATYQIFVEDQNEKGLMFIRILPHQALKIAKTAMNGEMEKMDLVKAPKGEVGDSLVYKITSTKTGNLLALFPMETESVITVGAQSGLVLDVNEPFWLRLLSPLII